MLKTKEKVSFSRDTWDELYKIDYFREVLEIIEDRESLHKSKEKAVDFVSFKEYDSNRRQICQ